MSLSGGKKQNLYNSDPETERADDKSQQEMQLQQLQQVLVQALERERHHKAKAYCSHPQGDV